MRSRWLTLLLVPLVALAACGSDDSGGDAATETSTATETASEPATETETEAAATGSETAEPVTRAEGDLVIWADDTRVQALQPFADQFAEEQDITVTLQELAFEQIRDSSRPLPRPAKAPTSSSVPTTGWDNA